MCLCLFFPFFWREGDRNRFKIRLICYVTFVRVSFQILFVEESLSS